MKQSSNKKRRKRKIAGTPVRMQKDMDDDYESPSRYESLEELSSDLDSTFTSTPMKKISPIKTMTPNDRISSNKEESPIASQKLLQTHLDRYDRERESVTDLDTEYGVRSLKNNMKIGDSVVTFHGNSMNLKGEKYTLTNGLIELIFKKSPNMSLITENNKHTYGNIIRSTNAHRMWYKPSGAIRTSSSMKYHNIIANLIDSKKTGTALPHHMIASVKPIKMDYVYWDDPNELVDRLRLLMVSQSAGNMSHTNEIMSILEELREAGIIY
ncbi:uncharacterized protein LOC107046280 [Diachasma alloeum]|uniref:uncharacterized protein LOC107046280 n=1 Tax=Diachasma alloeum TaxID=454923 RepID=UPI0007383C7B|nr:uncharacterized protein LOC107046280 [Diachasma alloeum]